MARNGTLSLSVGFCHFSSATSFLPYTALQDDQANFASTIATCVEDLELRTFITRSLADQENLNSVPNLSLVHCAPTSKTSGSCSEGVDLPQTAWKRRGNLSAARQREQKLKIPQYWVCLQILSQTNMEPDIAHPLEEDSSIQRATYQLPC